MNEICDRCGTETTWVDALGRIDCRDCYSATVKVRWITAFDKSSDFIDWLSRVIDRRIKKAFAERKLP